MAMQKECEEAAQAGHVASKKTSPRMGTGKEVNIPPVEQKSSNQLAEVTSDQNVQQVLTSHLTEFISKVTQYQCQSNKELKESLNELEIHLQELEKETQHLQQLQQDTHNILHQLGEIQIKQEKLQKIQEWILSKMDLLAKKGEPNYLDFIGKNGDQFLLKDNNDVKQSSQYDMIKTDLSCLDPSHFHQQIQGEESQANHEQIQRTKFGSAFRCIGEQKDLLLSDTSILQHSIQDTSGCKQHQTKNSSSSPDFYKQLINTDFDLENINLKVNLLGSLDEKSQKRIIKGMLNGVNYFYPISQYAPLYVPCIPFQIQHSQMQASDLDDQTSYLQMHRDVQPNHLVHQTSSKKRTPFPHEMTRRSHLSETVLTALKTFNKNQSSYCISCDIFVGAGPKMNWEHTLKHAQNIATSLYHCFPNWNTRDVSSPEGFQEMLLDNECALYMFWLPNILTSESSVPRNLGNPIAEMLTEDDDKHFIPIQNDKL